jgi:hypothetical protein
VNNTIVNDRASGTFINVASGALRAKIINNLFSGPGTLVTGPADTITNISTLAPNFVNRSTFDYHPTTSTPGINKGSDPGSNGAYLLMPLFQYLYNCNGEPRPAQGIIDIGAYEFAGSAIAAPGRFSPAKKASDRISSDGRHGRIIDVLGRTVPETVLSTVQNKLRENIPRKRYYYEKQ